MAMDNNNYVAPYNGGWIVVVNGVQRGFYGTQADAEGAYNALTNGGNINSGNTNSGNNSNGSGGKSVAQMRAELAAHDPSWNNRSDAEVVAEYNRLAAGHAGSNYAAGYVPGSESVTVGDYDWAALATQQKIAELQDAYNRSRLALDAIMGFAAETGWIDPSMMNQFLQAAGYSNSNQAGWKRADTGEIKTIEDMRKELIAAGGGWAANADDQKIIDEYGKLVEGGITYQEATPGNGPNGTQLTFAGAAQAASSYALGDTLGGLGLTPEGMPTYDAVKDKYPTLNMQEIMADPNTLVQSLLMTGMNPEQVAAYLESSPIVQSLLNQAYNPNGVPGGATGQANPVAAPAISGVEGTPYTPPTDAQPMGTEAPVGRSGEPYSWPQPEQYGAPAIGSDDPGFNFIQGNKMPIRQFLQMINTKDPMVGAYLSMADFAGYQPENWISEFQNILPKGGRNPLTSFI